jgi:LysR family transcriptional regulator, hypochlorite-specific transcription factor HypT
MRVMSGVDHKWFEDLIALARERSFSKAAQSRHVTQPQFSRRIRALEVWLGTDVVNRTQSPLTLTEAGEQMLPVARNITSAVSGLQERLRNTQQGGDWVVLATTRTLSHTWVPLWVQSLRRSMGAQINTILALEQGHADFMLSYHHPCLQLSIDSGAFDSITLAREELLAVSAPSSPGTAAHQLPGSAEHSVPMLRYAPSLALHLIVQDTLAQDGRTLYLHGVAESGSVQSLHEQALNGQGVAWLPRSLVQTDLQRGRLVLADPDAHPTRFEVQLWHPRTARNAQAQAVWKASVDNGVS